MIKKLINLTVLLTAIGISFSSTALACNCGCTDCAKAQEEINTANPNNEKLLCEAPKDWLLSFKQLQKIIESTTMDVVRKE